MQKRELTKKQTAGLRQFLKAMRKSDTKDSSTEYKYVEFVKAGQRLYKISEKTTLTFTLEQGLGSKPNRIDLIRFDAASAALFHAFL